MPNSEYQEFNWLLNHWVGLRVTWLISFWVKWKFIVFVMNLCLVFCWCYNFSFIFFFIVVSLVGCPIGDFVSNYFVILINKIQWRRISKSAANSGDTAEKNHQWIERNGWSWHNLFSFGVIKYFTHVHTFINRKALQNVFQYINFILQGTQIKNLKTISHFFGSLVVWTILLHFICLVWFGLVLWHINHCRLFNAKSFLYKYLKYINSKYIL